MINRLLIYSLLILSFCEVDANPYNGGETTTRITVVDQDGQRLEDMRVGVSYPDKSGIRYDSGDGLTDSTGSYEFSGEAFTEVYYSVQKEGYYFTRGEAKVYEGRGNDMRLLDRVEISVVAKEIRNPIVMLATRDFRAILPPPGTRVGFDFFENDLVQPYGEGKHSDVFFEITGEFEDRHNHDSLLLIEFAGEADGIIPFDMDLSEGSVLESGHAAPESGYQREKRTRKSVRTRKGLWPGQPGRVEYDKVDEVREDVGYYFRIRTTLDESGQVISAHYGKIYGDFDFYGAYPEGSYVTAKAYYLNPTPNDRNVEAVSGKSLFEGISKLDLPNSP